MSWGVVVDRELKKQERRLKKEANALAAYAERCAGIPDFAQGHLDAGCVLEEARQLIQCRRRELLRDGPPMA